MLFLPARHVTPGGDAARECPCRRGANLMNGLRRLEIHEAELRASKHRDPCLHPARADLPEIEIEGRQAGDKVGFRQDDRNGVTTMRAWRVS